MRPWERGRGSRLRSAAVVEEVSTADHLGATNAPPPGLARATMRAKMLCLRCYTPGETARRTRAVWSHLCLGCHYHQYEIGPTYEQVRAWRTEVGELVQTLGVP